MSNFIPMVSASPPPFDDHSFVYDDDDDFGTFTGADSHESSPGPPEPPPFESDREEAAADDNEKNNNPQTESPCDTNKNVNCREVISQNVTISETIVNGTEDSDDFANFEQYDANIDKDVSTKKPHLENLPIQSVNANSVEEGKIGNDNLNESKNKCVSSELGSCENKSPTCDKDTVQSTVTCSRDSTTDSGMFSTDISPVPKSEDTAELCDKSCESDNDDTFPDLPKDKSLSTDSLPVSDPDESRNQTTSGEDIDSRTSPVLESNPDECVSEASREDNSSVSQTQLEDVVTTLNKDDLSVSCSTDQQMSPLHSRDDSQQISEQKSSQDVSPGNEEGEEDEDDWGDFADSAEVGQVDVSGKNEEVVGDLDLRVENESSSGANSTSVQSEDECLEAIGEALKDSDNFGDQDSDVCSDNEHLKDKCESKNTDVDSSGNCTDMDMLKDKEETCDKMKEKEVSDSDDDDANQHSTHAAEISEPPLEVKDDDHGNNGDEEWNAFGEFSEAGADKGADWASFQDSDTPLPETLIDKSQSEIHNIPVDDDNDDFGDFGEFSEAKEEPEISKQDDSVAEASDRNVDYGEGDWADFDESVQKPVPSAQTISTTSQKPSAIPETHSMVSKEKLETILSSCFPSDADYAGQSLPQQLETILSTQLQQTIPSENISKKTQKGPGFVWGSLKDLDKTSALVYQWPTSAANTLMFKTLHIDTQNILFGHKKQPVPIFASNIGLLEPIRGGYTSAKPLEPKPTTLVDPDKTDDHAGGTQELPPVEFDWDNSGLTNPLTAKTLDLDFLCVQESESSNKNSVFQSEILDAPRSSVKSLPPLEDVLKNMKTTTTTKRRQDEHLSSEAESIIDALPILSFMTSKVLMFPLRQADN